MQRDNNDYLLSGDKLGIKQDKGEGKQAEIEKNKALGHLHRPQMKQLSCENEESSLRRNKRYCKSKSHA